MTNQRTYLDYNASAPLRPEAKEAMFAVFEYGASNASSVHVDGQRARRVIEEARETVAASLGARPKEIVFTASATEANNMAVWGSRTAWPDDRPALLARTTVEHPSVIGPMDWLQTQGIATNANIPVTSSGQIDWNGYRDILSLSPNLISIIAANNETGVVQPIQSLTAAAKETSALVHIDATQWVGRLPLCVKELGADMVTLSSHKLGGPQGAGALWVRQGAGLEALIRGGHQERNRRAGTENTAAIAGFGAAIHTAMETMESESIRQRGLRDALWAGIEKLDAKPRCYGIGSDRLPNTLNVSIGELDGETILIGLDLAGISISSGSACTAGSLDPSHVLLAMGVNDDEARGAVRFSFGYGSKQIDVDKTLEVLSNLVAQHDELEE